MEVAEWWATGCEVLRKRQQPLEMRLRRNCKVLVSPSTAEQLEYKGGLKPREGEWCTQERGGGECAWELGGSVNWW